MTDEAAGSELDEIRRAAVPRPEGLCARHARRIVRGPAVAGLALVYFIGVDLAASMVAMLVGVGALRLAGTHKGDRIEAVVTLALLVLVQVPVWLLFARDVRRRRQAAALLVREGAIVLGIVTERRAFRGASWYRVDFDLGGEPHHVVAALTPNILDAHLPEGTRVPVLARPGSQVAVAYRPDGRGVSERLR
ncbi:MAG TPA: hypothetical protein VHE35_11065 [Kofleriaceae bacterium]|nr:hypothetical protein [Kofleriaceae bacterium]